VWRGGLVHFRGRCENPLQLVDRVGIAWRNDQCSGEYRGSNPPTREVSGGVSSQKGTPPVCDCTDLVSWSSMAGKLSTLAQSDTRYLRTLGVS
jgi:hypothetical protein